MAAAIDMGGFGIYIWISYGFTAFCIVWLTYASWHKTKAATKLLDEVQKKQLRDTN